MAFLMHTPRIHKKRHSPVPNIAALGNSFPALRALSRLHRGISNPPMRIPRNGNFSKLPMKTINAKTAPNRYASSDLEVRFFKQQTWRSAIKRSERRNQRRALNTELKNICKAGIEREFESQVRRTPCAFVESLFAGFKNTDKPAGLTTAAPVGPHLFLVQPTTSATRFKEVQVKRKCALRRTSTELMRLAA